MPWSVDRYLRVLERGAPDNYIVIPKAVSLENGVKDFYIANRRLGCCSLYEFDDNVLSTWDSKYFKMSKKIKIDTIRLDTYIETNSIKKIDYLHCDAQGGDLDVLISLGNKINIVRHGVVEGHHRDKPLYKNNNSIDSIVTFLEHSGFIVTARDKILNSTKKELDIHFSFDGTRSSCYWP